MVRPPVVVELSSLPLGESGPLHWDPWRDLGPLPSPPGRPFLRSRDVPVASTCVRQLGTVVSTSE